MSETPEKKVKNKVKKRIENAGGYMFYPVMGGMGTNGIPDIIACVKGRFAGIETKAGKGKPTKLQLIQLRKIYEAGGTSLVINEDNLHILDHWLASPNRQMANVEFEQGKILE